VERNILYATGVGRHLTGGKLKAKYKNILDKYQEGLSELRSNQEVLKFNEEFRKTLEESGIDMDALTLGAHMFIRHGYKMDELDFERNK
jgi:hypothetical protein